MENEKEFEISIQTPQEKFKSHLELENNDRIIFSGMFGTGKTYFLDKYFENTEYNAIHLFPVNYEIASNEDIFKLIKYDILYDLVVEKNYDIDYDIVETTYDKYDLFGFTQHNIAFIIAYLAHFIPKIGKASSNLLEKTRHLWEKYKGVKHENELEESEFHQFSNFVKNTEQHYLLESDIITQIIEDALQKIKADEKTKNILVIDDLDRIDPEHIFRLLNIFAAHSDAKSELANKFGFDKIILVLDINNIRNIFHTKYGSDTDFSGYINKFYSYEVFDFDNTDAIVRNVNEILYSITIDEKFQKVLSFTDSNSSDIEIFSKLITLFVNNHVINLRTLLKLKDYNYHLHPYDVHFPELWNMKNWHLYSFIIFNFFELIFGSYSGLIKGIAKFIKNRSINSIKLNYNWIIGQLLIPLDFNNHKFRDGKEMTYSDFDLDLKIDYEIKETIGTDQYYAKILATKRINDEIVELNNDILFSIMHKSFIKIDNLKRFKKTSY